MLIDKVKTIFQKSPQTERKEEKEVVHICDQYRIGTEA